MAVLVVTLLGGAWAQGTTACLPAADRAVVAEARSTIERRGPLLWPGWREAPPVLLRGEGEDCLLDHPEPPEDFVAGEDGVHRRSGHLLPVPVATAYPVGSRWSVVVPLRTEVQALLDQRIGPGALVLDDLVYRRVLVHEAFHAHQMTVVGGPGGVPAFGDDARATPSLEALAAVPGHAAALDRQGAALQSALRAGSIGEARRAGRRFLAARDAWRSTAPPGTAGVERQLEWIEGTARYVDVLAALAPAGGETWSDLLTQLEAPSEVPTGPRDAYAALGAGQAFLLDRLLPSWKGRVLPGGEALEDLLRDAVSERTAG
ncbi:MAG: hypothetical protein GVY27_05230 [Deinococcus-Thermus bacterium]|nr:hypothetical protein [Deinococcota bacterium]